MKFVRRGIVTSGYDQRWEVLFSDVGAEVRKALTCHRLGDPAVRLAIKCEADVGEGFVAWAEGKTYREMEEGLGKGWHYRICNLLGDVFSEN